MLTGLSWLYLLTDKLDTPAIIDAAIRNLCLGLRNG
jgi:hypothetical protein